MARTVGHPATIPASVTMSLQTISSITIGGERVCDTVRTGLALAALVVVLTAALQAVSRPISKMGRHRFTTGDVYSPTTSRINGNPSAATHPSGLTRWSRSCLPVFRSDSSIERHGSWGCGVMRLTSAVVPGPMPGVIDALS
jgi:hypothetical protein